MEKDAPFAQLSNRQAIFAALRDVLADLYPEETLPVSSSPMLGLMRSKSPSVPAPKPIGITSSPKRFARRASTRY